MASASNSTSLYTPSYPSKYPYTLSVSFNETGTSTPNNTSTISCSASFSNLPGKLYWSTSENKTLQVYWYDDNNNANGTLVAQVQFKSIAKAGQTYTASGDITVTHKDNGTLNGYAQARWIKTGSYGGMPNSANLNTANTALTTIARYANITSYSVSKRSATSFSVSWGADVSCDAVQYRYKTSSSSSYGSWTGASGTSFNIGSLSANTTYNVQIRVKRTDSQLWTESSVATQTTNKLPTQSLNNKTETTIKMNWSSDVTASHIWFSHNNGANWYDVGNVNATSGSYNITGLSANTTYNIKTRVRRSSNSIDEDTSALAVTTYKIPTQSLKSKTETSITMNWAADSTISKVEYSINNGSSYTQATANANATSGSYTISGLTANTAYNIKTRVTRSATGTNYGVSAVLAVTTYQYPYVSAVGTSNLTIGNSQTLTLYNPLSRSCTVYMKKDNTSGTQLYSGTTSGTSITFTPTASTLYNSIPSSTSGTAVYYCVYSSQNMGTKTGTYTINNSGGELNPTFANTNWSYTANLTELTNDDQVVIKNQSTVTYSIDTAPTFKYNATLKNYKLEWGTKNSTTTTTSGTVQNGDSATLKVTAIDSRNYYTETSKALGSNYIEYFNPTMNNGTTHRESGVGTDTTLTINGTMFHQNFGSAGVLNEFTAAKYYVSTDNSTWSNAFDIPVSNITYDNNNYKIENYQIHANGSSGGFVVGTRYYIKVDLTDKINTHTFTGITVTDGKLAKDVYQDNNGEYHTGINGLANSNYALYVYGKVGSSEGFETYSTTEKVIGTYDNKPLYRKILTGTTASTAGDKGLINLSSLNIAKITNMYGFVAYTSNSTFSSGTMVPINYYYDSSHFACFYYYSTNKSLYCYTQTTNAPFEIIIEYTKTTD